MRDLSVLNHFVLLDYNTFAPNCPQSIEHVYGRGKTSSLCVFRDGVPGSLAQLLILFDCGCRRGYTITLDAASAFASGDVRLFALAIWLAIGKPRTWKPVEDWWVDHEEEGAGRSFTRSYKLKLRHPSSDCINSEHGVPGLFDGCDAPCTHSCIEVECGTNEDDHRGWVRVRIGNPLFPDGEWYREYDRVWRDDLESAVPVDV